jgi:hypothetical protein
MKNELEKLYSTEMGRGDFLKYVGALFLTVIGISGLMRALLQHNHQSLTSSLGKNSTGQGYGTSGYGGFLGQDQQ